MTDHENAIEAVASKLRSPSTFPGETATAVARELIDAYIKAGGFDSVPALLDRIEELEKERDEIAERHRAEICDMAERFRSVNLSAALDMLPADTKQLLDRATTAESKLAEARAEALEEAARAAETAQISGSLLRPGIAEVIRALKSGGGE